jgi:hypothetical protein
VRSRTVFLGYAVILGLGLVLAEFVGVDPGWMAIALWSWLIVVIVAGASGPYTDEMLDRWSLRYDVAMDHPRREWIRARLCRARRARWAAVGLGMGVAWTPTFVGMVAPEHSGFTAVVFLGWNTPLIALIAAALGTLISELVVVQRPRGARLAALERRKWGHYVGDHWRSLLTGSSGVAVLAAAAVLSDRSRHPSTDGRVAAVAAAWTVVALVLALVGMRAIVDRPLLAVAGMDRQLDEALRADGAHHLVGAAVAMSLFGSSVALNEVLPGGLPGLLVFVFGPWFGVACWWFLARQETWNVERVRWRRA